MEQLNFRIVLRHDSTANWLANESSVLLRGEIGVEFFDDGKVKFKIGDGVTPWSGLSYFGGEIIGDKKSIDIVNETLHLVGFETAEVGAHPVKGEDGSLAWVLLEPTLTELQNRLTKAEKDIADLYDVVGSAATADTEATGLFALINKKANADVVYTKDEVNALVSSVYRYRGSVSKYTDLPTEGVLVGDVWNIETGDIVHDIKAGDNVVWNGTTWDKLAGTVDLSDYITKEEFTPVKTVVDEMPLYYLTKKQADAEFNRIKYEVTNKPVNTLVNYRDKEIRIMCPSDTVWTHQSVGPTGNANNYYVGFKVYAPSDDIISFKEDMKEKIEDNTMHYFENNSFAGIDAYGRKYSLIWLSVARYDEDTDTWTYYGANSSYKKFIGWTYSVEWYNANGVLVASDSIRINLTNENCHNSIEPYYMGNVVKGIKYNGTLLDLVDNVVSIDLPAIKSSPDENKIRINDDGTMEVNSLNVNRLTQTDGEWMILNGGSSEM
jgi:hypothetical protein